MVDRVIHEAMKTFELPGDQLPMLVMPPRQAKPIPNAPLAGDSDHPTHTRVIFHGQEYPRRAMQMVLLHDKGLSHSMGRAIYDLQHSNLPKPSEVDLVRKQFDDHITKLGLVIITVMWHSTLPTAMSTDVYD